MIPKESTEHRVLPDDLGYQVLEGRVWRLCNKAGIRSVISNRLRKHTQAGPPVHDDRVQRDFTAEQPNQL